MSDEWIENTGVMPVPGDVLVDVKFTKGDIQEGHPAIFWSWYKEVWEGDITHWRLHKVFVAAKLEQEVEVGVNPKENIGKAKLPLHLWSPLASAYGSVGLANGEKYGYGNYKATPVLMSIYLAATLRHLFAFMEGQECDPIEGTPHISAILANMAIILEARSVGTIIDDRSIQGGYLKEIEKLTEIANSLHQLHKDTKAYHYTIKDSPKGQNGQD